MKDIPIYITSFNRLSCLQDLVTWLASAGYTNIIIIDNASTYPPLLTYLDTVKGVTVIRLDKNWGFYGPWESGVISEEIWMKQYYVVTDPDVVPCEDCPADALEYMKGILDRHPEVEKAGFGLRLDDIPDHYKMKQRVLGWERQWWVNPIPGEEQVFRAAIDTTFSLYRPGKRMWCLNGARTGKPYLARHTTWYKDLNKLTEEDLHYIKTSIQSNSHWYTTGH